MRFQTVQVLNYKCFRDSGEITFNEGFNAIVGKNDSGKSSLVEALGLQAENKPHRSLLTMPEVWSQPALRSTLNAGISITSGDLMEALSRVPQFSMKNMRGEDLQSAEDKLKRILKEPGKLIIESVFGGRRNSWLENYDDNSQASS